MDEEKSNSEIAISEYKKSYRHRLKQNDLIRLGQAVSSFNKKIDRIRTEENKAYIPSKVDYTTLKNEIISKAELDRVINSLNRFKKENAEDLYITQAGEKLTRWERAELGRGAGVIKRRISNELKELGVPLESGFSRAEMGSSRVSELRAQYKNLEKLENLRLSEFERLKQRIERGQNADYKLKQAIIYRYNYMSMLEKAYSNYENYEKFKKVLDRFTNPISFYKFLSQNEKLADIIYMYETSGKAIATVNDEQTFNFLLESFGIEI